MVHLANYDIRNSTFNYYYIFKLKNAKKAIVSENSRAEKQVKIQQLSHFACPRPLVGCLSWWFSYIIQDDLLWTLVYQASELQRLLTQKENLLVLGDQKGLFSSPEMVTLLNADVLLVTASLHPKRLLFGWRDRSDDWKYICVYRLRNGCWGLFETRNYV